MFLNYGKYLSYYSILLICFDFLPYFQRHFILAQPFNIFGYFPLRFKFVSVCIYDHIIAQLWTFISNKTSVKLAENTKYCSHLLFNKIIQDKHSDSCKLLNMIFITKYLVCNARPVSGSIAKIFHNSLCESNSYLS